MESTSNIDDPVNVLGEKLQPCSHDPLTGYYRDGCCNTADGDFGSHTICVEVNQEFLEYTRFRGNDLSTPVQAYGFPGLKPGDCWCLCATRWLEALENGMAPKVFLHSTHKRALEVVNLSQLQANAADPVAAE